MPRYQHEALSIRPDRRVTFCRLYRPTLCHLLLEHDTMTAYINTHHTRADGTKDTFHSFAVESKDAPLWHHDKGLSYTATGYGKRIPTRHMVRFNDKWRRVYCCIYSNIGTCYIGKLADGLIVSHIEG